MRKSLLVLAALSTLAFSSAAQAGGFQIHSDASPTVTLIGAKHQGHALPLSLRASGGGRAKSTFPQGCVYGNDNITRCTQICIASASGNMCAAENTCYNNNGEVIGCN